MLRLDLSESGLLRGPPSSRRVGSWGKLWNFYFCRDESETAVEKWLWPRVTSGRQAADQPEFDGCPTICLTTKRKIGDNVVRHPSLLGNHLDLWGAKNGTTTTTKKAKFWIWKILTFWTPQYKDGFLLICFIWARDALVGQIFFNRNSESGFVEKFEIQTFDRSIVGENVQERQNEKYAPGQPGISRQDVGWNRHYCMNPLSRSYHRHYWCSDKRLNRNFHRQPTLTLTLIFTNDQERGNRRSQSAVLQFSPDRLFFW